MSAQRQEDRGPVGTLSRPGSSRTGQVRAGPAPGAHQPSSPRRLTVTSHPEVSFTWASNFPDKVKFRKRLDIWPLRFMLRADYDRQHRSFQYGCSCKDKLLGGVVRVDIPSSQLEYRKRLDLGNGAHLGLSARCSYAGLLRGEVGAFNPVIGFQCEFGHGAAVWAQNQIDLRQKVRVTRNLAIEACGSAELPLPRAQYAVNSDANTLTMGEGTFHLHVAQLNAIFHL
ncbi:hypothetical protein WJX72_011351 [[Myrmecia] bisecta]|uniref:Uncharacterized protein n=1 Tax=[Myrmecia] bisecta TaxID=41462 RepID=A0AAW1PDK8_9CHLO